MFLISEQAENDALGTIIVVLTLISLVMILLERLYRGVEAIYAEWFDRPFVVHFYLFRQKLSPSRKHILTKKVAFYNNLSDNQKANFEHRVARFIKSKNFIGRKGLTITDEIMVEVAATAVMITFGMRHYRIANIDHILVYPSVFYSKTNHQYHKGEFNPKIRTLVFSWEHFREGFDITNDKLNLGIHEFTHAIQFDFMQQKHVSAIIFNYGNKTIHSLLKNNPSLKKRLITSRFFRDYAYTNQFEFLAVILESFFEAPTQFKMQFPKLYKAVKTMLNFKFAPY
jgi:MtfA peptidase